MGYSDGYRQLLDTNMIDYNPAVILMEVDVITLTLGYCSVEI